MEQGIFTYYGDNRAPGRELHETHVGGNLLLREVFSRLHSGLRRTVPPFLCFESVRLRTGAYMKFLGLAVPGANNLSSVDDLQAVWKMQPEFLFK